MFLSAWKHNFLHDSIFKAKAQINQVFLLEGKYVLKIVKSFDTVFSHSTKKWVRT